jgi:hypothetical protein
MTTVLKPAVAEATSPPLPSPFTPIAERLKEIG